MYSDLQHISNSNAVPILLTGLLVNNFQQTKIRPVNFNIGRDHPTLCRKMFGPVKYRSEVRRDHNNVLRKRLIAAEDWLTAGQKITQQQLMTPNAGQLENIQITTTTKSRT